MAHFDAIDGTDNPGFFTDLVQKGKDILFVRDRDIKTAKVGRLL